MRLNQPSIAAIGLTAALTALAPRPTPAQTPTPQNTPANTETLQVYTRETIVDIVVTDDKGRHVRGLKQSDFSVEEDGNPQPIRSFKESGVSLAAARPQPKLPPGMYTNAHAAPATGPVNIILIDSLNSPNANLVVLAQQQIVSYLKSMPEGNQVAIFSLNFNGLQVLQGFTSDRNLLLRAMDKNFLVYAPNGEVINRPWATIDALDNIGAYVAAIKGRKNLLWFAPGVPVMLTRDGGYQWGASDMAIVHRLMDTYELFTNEQIAVSPVDIRGVIALNSVPLAKAAMRMDNVAEDTGGIVYAESNDLAAELGKAIDDGSHYYTLSYLTPHHLSAGHYHKIKITTNRPGLHLVYRTGYNDEPPPEPFVPTGPKLIQAAMQGQAPPSTQLLFDLRISPIPGAPPVASTIPDPFSDSDPFAFSNSFANTSPAATPTADRAAAQPSAADQTPPPDPSAPLVNQAGRRVLTGPDKTRYTFVYAIPQSQIAFTANPDGTHTGSLEFDIGAYDSGNRLINSLSQTLHMPLAPDEYADFIRTPFKFSQQLDLPPGPAYLRIGILDPTSNKVGTLELQITVPKPTPTPR
ncbi:MAG: VWA domain-containing protein [Acidobacteriaceae bacterium]|jgi:VWFA-related protein